MTVSRRQFVVRGLGGAAGLALLHGGCAARHGGARAGVNTSPSAFHALPDESAWRLADAVLDAAAAAKVTYADVRVCSYRWQRLNSHDGLPSASTDSASHGCGVRVLCGGGWGFASTPLLTAEGVTAALKRAVDLARASGAATSKPWPYPLPERHVDTYVTPHVVDPFSVSPAEKMDLLIAMQRPARQADPSLRTDAAMAVAREEKFFASTVGSRIQQTIIRSDSSLSVTASLPKLGFKTRTYAPPARNAGYEDVRDVPWADHARRIAREAVEYLRAPRGPDGERVDLVLLPSNLHLTIHESVGHPTELDRALLWEADYAGTTFATPDKLDSFQYGSSLVNLTGDRTLPNGRGTVKYDDEGTPTRRYAIVKDGIFVGHASDRISAALIGRESTGCAYADSWNAVPIVRMGNTSLEADPKGPSVDALIADTADGILIDGLGAYSIDHQRKNFQFGGDMFWRIRNGRIDGPLRDVTYHGNTWEFWRSCDAVGGPDAWEPWGVDSCGKGQPSQTGQMTHGCPPARFRRVSVGGARA